MLLGQNFERFVEESPISVMVRGVLENAFHPDQVDALFERTAQSQYTRDLLFSSLTMTDNALPGFDRWAQPTQPCQGARVMW